MHPDVYYRVIAPTLVTGSAFVGITTLGDDTNYVGKIIGAISKRTGKPIFNTIELNLVCRDCLESGKASECIHRLGEIPYWQDDERHKDLQEVINDVTITQLLDYERKRRRLLERNKGNKYKCMGQCSI
jgi:hypothetical protein